MEDKTITCKDCGTDFILTADNQLWYSEKGLAEPKRCKSCRIARRKLFEGKEN